MFILVLVGDLVEFWLWVFRIWGKVVNFVLWSCLFLWVCDVYMYGIIILVVIFEKIWVWKIRFLCEGIVDFYEIIVFLKWLVVFFVE